MTLRLMLLRVLGLILVGLLVGGFAGTVLTIITGHLAERRERRARVIDDQIRMLYGPIYYLVSQSEKSLDLNRSSHIAYSNEYEKEWS